MVINIDGGKIDSRILSLFICLSLSIRLALIISKHHLLIYNSEHVLYYLKYVLLVHDGSLIEINVSKCVTKILRLSLCIPPAIRLYIKTTENNVPQK